MTRAERLGDYVDVSTGFPFKSDEYADDGIRLLRGDNITQGKLRWAGVKRWPAARSHESERYFLLANDVVLAMDRPWIEAGLKYAYIRDSDLPSLLVQRVARLRARDGMDQSFLRYLIGSPSFTSFVLGVQTGTGVPHISVGQICDFRFSLVPISAQLAIAEVLGALDDKITVNEQIADTALSLADRYYQAVRHDADMGSTVTVAKLAIDGRIQFGDGYRTKKSEHGVPGLPILRVADVVDGEIRPNFGDHVREEFRSTMGARTSRAGDVVLTTKGTVGRVAMISPAHPEFVYSPQVCYFRTANGATVSNLYLFHWMRGGEFGRQAAGMKGQTDMADYLSLSDIKSLRITLPSGASLAEFNWKCAALHARGEAARNENRTLAELRDTLLPQLVTGKLRVKDAVRTVENAV